MSKMVQVILQVGVEVDDNVDLDTDAGYRRALDAAAQDVSTRGAGEILEAITDIEYGG